MGDNILAGLTKPICFSIPTIFCFLPDGIFKGYANSVDTRNYELVTKVKIGRRIEFVLKLLSNSVVWWIVCGPGQKMSLTSKLNLGCPSPSLVFLCPTWLQRKFHPTALILANVKLMKHNVAIHPWSFYRVNEKDEIRRGASLKGENPLANDQHRPVTCQNNQKIKRQRTLLLLIGDITLRMHLNNWPWS